MSVRLWHAVLAASFAVVPAALSAQQAAGPSAAVISMREQWLNPAVNSFTFRDTDKVFESRAVPRSACSLPRRPLPSQNPGPAGRSAASGPARRGGMRCMPASWRRG